MKGKEVVKLIINENELEIAPKNTNFVDYWTTKVFKNSNTIQCSMKSLSEGKTYNLHNFKKHKVNLLNLLYEFNQIVELEKLPSELSYNLQDSVEPKYLQYVHEKWAHFTIQSYHVPSPHFNLEIKEYCDILNHKLNERFNSSIDTRTINNYVHNLEHLYLHYQTIIILLDDIFPYGEYRVTEQDTIFGIDNLMISFWDIGRPQYEKWILSKDITSNEISNFETISPRVEVRAESTHTVPHDDYVNLCKKMNIPVWGNKLPLGNIKHINYYDIGYSIINSMKENESDYVGFKL